MKRETLEAEDGRKEWSWDIPHSCVLLFSSHFLRITIFKYLRGSLKFSTYQSDTTNIIGSTQTRYYNERFADIK